ncbi:hypothetical protein OSG44_002821 [Enterobacter mori]|nr:hypothetical protein [Enterobacter mori]
MADITYKPTVEVNGRTWFLHSLTYRDADERKYSVYFYALSKEHASYIVEEIRSTAELDSDTILGVYD